jgi:hypothetical protein
MYVRHVWRDTCPEQQVSCPGIKVLEIFWNIGGNQAREEEEGKNRKKCAEAMLLMCRYTAGNVSET